MKVITVCGSLRDINKMKIITEEMCLKGNCMLTPVYPTRENVDSYSKEELRVFKDMHLERIKISDAILVLDFDGYIGNSTRKKNEYAKSLGKEIIYYSNIEGAKFN